MRPKNRLGSAFVLETQEALARHAVADSVQRPNDEYPDVAFHSDPRPGHYFVTVVNDHGQRASLLGPYPTHQEALNRVSIARDYAITRQASATWYRYGTCRLDPSVSPEVLRAWEGRFNADWPLEYADGTQSVRPVRDRPEAAPRHVLNLDVNSHDKLPPDYLAHNGQQVRVLGAWPSGEVTGKASEPLRVAADDGWEGEVLGAELIPRPRAR